MVRRLGRGRLLRAFLGLPKIVKTCRAHDGVSIAGALRLYRDALSKARWSIVSGGGDSLAAHYGLGGRNIRAFIRGGDGVYLINVADATIVESTLIADLSDKCRFALTGVLFDFNKSKLKPESDSVLEQVSAVMVKDRTLKLEIQGHTDDATRGAPRTVASRSPIRPAKRRGRRGRAPGRSAPREKSKFN